MPLTALQSYNIEKALIRGKTIEAIKLYREATNCSLVDAKTEIDRNLAQLKLDKPWYFKESHQEAGLKKPRKISIKKSHIVLFFLVDTLIFGALAYYFLLRDSPATPLFNSHPAQAKATESPSIGRSKAASLPSSVEAKDYSTQIGARDTFDSLYHDKLDSGAYIARKNSAKSSSYDDSQIEKQIKTARSLLAQQRIAPANTPVLRIASSVQHATLDGIIDDREWGDATPIVVDEEFNTTLYLKTDGQWLFIACDTPRETSQGGYDQLRIYLHAGLNDHLVNERIHIGRRAGITSIRQTHFRWQGKSPNNDNERWKKYAISDWGIYRHAQGTSSMSSGHRQYEAAIHLGEAGLHRGVPFTLYLEVETDPLKNEQGKFLERQYLGELGNEDNPQWMVF